jgi:hypothetical protein
MPPNEPFPPPPESEHARSREVEQRIDEVQQLLADNTPIPQIRLFLMEKYGRSRATINGYIRKAWERFADIRAERRKHLLGRAYLRYEKMLLHGLEQMRRQHVREKLIQLPEAGPDGRPKRRVEILRETLPPAAAVRLALSSADKLDKLDGLDRPAADAEPVTVEVNFPELWSQLDAVSAAVQAEGAD